MTLLDALSEGPARLKGEDVAAAQRRRLLAAMISAAAERGYANVSVADVVGRARVSRATFYDLFDSKQDCFLAAFTAAVEDVLGFMAGRAAAGPRPESGPTKPRDRLRALLGAFLDALAASPELSRVCLVEIYAAGVPGAKLRRQMQASFVALIRAELESAVAAGAAKRVPTDFELEVFVGAISSLVTNRVATGEGETLPSLLEPLDSLVRRLLA